MRIGRKSYIIAVSGLLGLLVVAGGYKLRHVRVYLENNKKVSLRAKWDNPEQFLRWQTEIEATANSQNREVDEERFADLILDTRFWEIVEPLYVKYTDSVACRNVVIRLALHAVIAKPPDSVPNVLVAATEDPDELIRYLARQTILIAKQKMRYAPRYVANQLRARVQFLDIVNEVNENAWVDVIESIPVNTSVVQVLEELYSSSDVTMRRKVVRLFIVGAYRVDKADGKEFLSHAKQDTDERVRELAKLASGIIEGM